MHLNLSVPKSEDIFVRNGSVNDFSFHKKDEFANLYSTYLATNNIEHVLLLEAVAVLGLFVAICGYRFLKLAMFTSGFCFAFAAFYVFSPRFINTKYCCTKQGKEEVHVASSAVFGIIIGLIVSRLYKVGIFFIGKSLGLLAALLLLQTPIGSYFKSNLTVGLLFTFMAMIFGSLANKFEKSFVITSTSVFGSYVAVCGIDIFLKSSFSFAVLGFIIYFKEIFQAGMHSKWHLAEASLPHLHLTVSWLEKDSMIMLGTWLALSLISCLVQFKVTAKDLKEGGNICPFNFKACLCSCCVKTEETKTHQEKETVYLFTNVESLREFSQRRK